MSSHDRTYQYIVRFDVRVHDVSFLEQTQGKEELMCISSYGLDIQANIFAKAFDNVPEIHAVSIHQERKGKSGDHTITHLNDSKTRQRCPRCSNVLSKRTMCFLSSGSACLNLFKIWTSFSPARCLNMSSALKPEEFARDTDIDSWLLMILIATSLPLSPAS